MENEHSLGHKNSPHYNEMKEALRTVCEMDPGDPGMKHALDELYSKAETYAEKNAFSTKKTPLGIQRKNTALLLMNLSDPHRTQATLDRHNGLEDLRLKTFKKKTDFKTLMSDEMKRNERKYEHKATKRKYVREYARESSKAAPGM